MQILAKKFWFAYTFLIITEYVNPSNSTSARSQQSLTKALPGNGETWSHLINNHKVYVDKTMYLREMLKSWPTQSFWFLTRPRRFSKSVFVQMAKEFLLGNKEMFHGLDIYNDGNTRFFNACSGKTYKSAWTSFAVLHLDFNEIAEFDTYEEFTSRYKNLLKAAVNHHGIDTTSLPYYYGMSDIITLFYHHSYRSPVMIFIDEYDKPFYAAKYLMKNDALAKQIAQFMDRILSEVKGSHGLGKVGFVFVTGVSRLGLKIMETGANVFEDITYDSRFNDAFGFTKDEIRSFMEDHLTEFARKKNYLPVYDKSPEDLIIKDLEQMYDGYRFDIKNNAANKIFNPVSVIGSLSHKKLEKYWCATSSSQYVVEKFYTDTRQWHIQNFIDGFEMSEKDILNARNPMTVATDLPMYMLTYGYLTIKSYSPKKKTFHLKFPNTEIRDYITEQLVNISIPKSQLSTSTDELFIALDCGLIERAIELIEKRVFYVRDGYKATAGEIDNRIYDVLKLSGVELRSKIIFKKDTKKKNEGGDIDHFTTNLRYNYVMSLKCGHESALDAIEQLVNYTRECPGEFWNTVDIREEQNLVYFLGWNFTYYDGGRLCNWILIPYKNRSPNMDAIKSNSIPLQKEFAERMNHYFEIMKKKKLLKSISIPPEPRDVFDLIQFYRNIHQLQFYRYINQLQVLHRDSNTPGTALILVRNSSNTQQ